jgi:hypothetical protein
MLTIGGSDALFAFLIKKQGQRKAWRIPSPKN